MTWDINAPYCPESDKIAALVIPYTRGKALDLGCGVRKVWPCMIGIDNGRTFGQQTDADITGKIDDLSLFADESVDSVYSSHALEDFPEEEVPRVLREWTRILKVGGHLVLYLPSANLYPLVGEKGANPDHKWNIYPGDIERKLVESTACGWTQLECEERDKGNEYSLFEVYQKRGDGKFEKHLWERNPEGKKRCLVIRYGAIGDTLLASSILPGLKRQGYYITYNCTPASHEIIKHDPHIDEFLLQDNEQVPNASLGPYWEALSERYDRIINLCESVERSLLMLPGRLEHKYSSAARQKIAGHVNYLERTHDIADVPHDFSPRFYMTDQEKYWARKLRAEINGPVVCIALNGSSVHKVYPYTERVISWLLKQTPAHIFLCADPKEGKLLQDAIMEKLKENGDDLSRVYPKAGEWKIRQALTFAHFADCVFGPETGLLNAVGFAEVKKVILLSHSSHDNLTKHWRNTVVLTQDDSLATACKASPCHQLHYDWSGCFKDEDTGASKCSASILPERVFREIALAIGAKKAA